jgi:ribosomal-protein-alanine N-acetyltransferase
MFFKELETDRLFLKNISSDDRDFMFTIFSNDTINRYLFDEEPLTDIQDADEIINFYTQPEPRIQHRWVIVRKTDNSKLGTCGFHAWDKSNAYCEIGYELYPDYWGNGYMSEAMGKILEFARFEMKVKNINACIYIDNDNSIKLAEKFGFVFKGQMKDYNFRGQKYSHKIYNKQ